MSDDVQLTRRGILQMVSAVLTAASFATRRPLFGAHTVDTGGLPDAEVIEEEPPIADRARGAKLEQFLRSRGIRPAHLARECGYSRAHLLGIRLGRVQPTGRCAVEIVAACRRLAGEPLRPSDLFDFPRRCHTHPATHRLRPDEGDGNRPCIAYVSLIPLRASSAAATFVAHEGGTHDRPARGDDDRAACR